MSAVTVFCPHCGKGLKLRDRSKLGRKGVCPSCQQTFVLSEPKPQSTLKPPSPPSPPVEEEEEEIELQLAPPAAAREPAVGTGARWVPDHPATPQPAHSTAGWTAAPEPAGLASDPFLTPAEGFAAATPAADDSPDGFSKLREIKRRNAQRKKRTLIGGGVLVLLVGGLIWGAMSLSGDKDSAPTTAAAPATPATSAETPAAAATDSGVTIPSVAAGPTAESVKLPHQSLTRLHMVNNEQMVSDAVPRRGEPIALKMTPSGVNVVIHLRPARLWSDDPIWQEVRYSLTEDFTNWLAARLKTICRRDPQQIEECLITLRLGATGTEPDISTVVYLAQEEKRSDLIEEFRGQALNEAGGPRVNVAGPWAYLVRDTKTFAIATAGDASELSQFADSQNPNSSGGVYQFLKDTDNQRVFTVIFEVDDVKRHFDWLLTDSTRPAIQHILDWIGDDVETIAWSLDVHDDNLVSDLYLRARSTANPVRVAGNLLERFETLPDELVAMCRKMSPATEGFQAIIGRFPAMVEVYRQATVPTLITRNLRLTTVLPQKAAPNLALGALLTWDQAMQTDFSAVAPAPAMVASAGPAIPDSVVDRLKTLQLDAEFNNMPLQDALSYVAGECKVTLELDGNALKDAGFTQNMPQKFNLGRVSGMEVLRHIVQSNNPLDREKRLCIVIDEANKSFLVTTETFAKAQGRTIYSLSP